jgi:hypothetical protein
MTYTQCSLLFLLIPSLLVRAQDNLPNSVALPNYAAVPASDRDALTGAVNDAVPESGGTFSAFQFSSAKSGSGRQIPTHVPSAFSPPASGSDTQNEYDINVPASDRETSAGALNYAALRLPPSPFQISSANPSSIRWISTRLPIALSPQSSGANTPQASRPNPPKQANWARRHALLLAGLAATGAGAALMATGGNGQGTLCGPYGPYGSVECATASTWGFGGQHIAGILLVCAGVPVTIWGLFKH